MTKDKELIEETNCKVCSKVVEDNSLILDLCIKCQIELIENDILTSRFSLRSNNPTKVGGI